MPPILLSWLMKSETYIGDMVEGESSRQLPIISFAMLQTENLVKLLLTRIRCVSLDFLLCAKISLINIHLGLLNICGNQTVDVSTGNG